MKRCKLLLPPLCCIISFLVFIHPTTAAQQAAVPLFPDSLVTPRMRIIIDNDFGGDPDGLFQLVQHLLSPSVEIRGIIGSHLRPGDGWDPSNETATHAKQKAEELLRIMHLEKAYTVYQGSNFPLQNDSTPQKSDAAGFIIKEAMRDDTKLPLYVVCGAGLTDIASALLMEPAIAKHLTLIWIGGPEYPGLATPPPGYTTMEYNLGIDLTAGQVVFNKSAVPIWQIPRNVYRQVMMPYSSMLLKVRPQGTIGEYLTTNIERIMKMGIKFNFNVGEVYIVGDSPLVLLTALQSSFEPDPSSSFYVLRPSPLINNLGIYEINHKGRNIRVYTALDVPLLLDDLYAKLALYNIRKL
ncbi:nucleoside hydrolase [Panacibacter sp. DH6]|uniref:Nucleoside hydrolase n=1 Tax=Panacibacter microcysteis TaxID=2793269 RepID=A0A931GYL8_9BACT|nr:nucleoside hydrolase [Panacibacter microcysteis]MBG9376677.1 nucleoside hydrolase [Panacibacter microcysteis]